MQVLWAILVLGGIAGLFIWVYTNNQKTAIPKEHENTQYDGRGCHSINRSTTEEEDA